MDTLAACLFGYIRMEAFVVLILLGACSAQCNLPLTYNHDEIIHSYLDVATNMIAKAKYYVPANGNSRKCQLKKAVDCADVLDMGHNKSGVYEIWPTNRLFEGKSVYVYCDMETDGGGWTVIQRRGKFNTPKDYFFRDWDNYKKGFGNIKEDFWLGNDNIFALTNQKLYSVRFDLRDFEKDQRYALYDNFWIAEEECNYTLHISLYTGDSGESMGYHNNLKFSTFDKNDNSKCSQTHKGGWWYGSKPRHCHETNLNGLYYTEKYKSPNWDGISWNQFRNGGESLQRTEIKIRPKHFKAIL